jgi:PAS domain S-box-containing protein
MNSAKILVAEDNLIVAEHIRESLLGLGYVVPAMTGYGEEAVKMAAEVRPDLVLMDIGLLGGMDGIQAATQLRHLNIPVIYLTSRLDRETVQRATATEPFGFVSKPFGEQELRAAIEIALCRRRIERELRDRELWLSATLRGVGQALITTDHTGRVMVTNDMAERLTGWSQAEARSRAVGEVLCFVGAEGGQEPEDPFKPVLRQATAMPASRYLLRSRQGARVAVHCSAEPIRDSAGRVSGAIIVLVADKDAP